MISKKRLLLNTISVLVFILPMTTHAKDSIAEWCEQEWKVESAKAFENDPPDYAGLLERWQQHRQQCAGTVAYEARLAIAYLFLDQEDQARQVLQSLDKHHSSKYENLVELAWLQINVTELMKRHVTTEDIQKLENKYELFVKKYPDFPDGYALLGGLQTTLDRYPEAISSLEKGLHTSMDTSGIYRNLTICYTEVGRYKEAKQAADKAYELKKSVTSDQYFAYAVAKSDAALGNFHGAETVLRVIAAKKPEVRRDPKFKEVVDFVTARMESQKE